MRAATSYKLISDSSRIQILNLEWARRAHSRSSSRGYSSLSRLANLPASDLLTLHQAVDRFEPIGWHADEADQVRAELACFNAAEPAASSSGSGLCYTVNYGAAK